MVDGVSRCGGVLSSFRKDERSLNRALRKQGEAFGSPIGLNATLLHRCVDIGNQRCRMAADGAFARLADRRMCAENLLGHGADEAGKLRQFALQKSLAKID